ncbi:MAG: hypothetical protein WCP35_14700 [Verrucomicrobiota bacterium]
MHTPRFTLRLPGSIAAFICLAGLLPLVEQSVAADAAPPPAKSIGFETHDGYFVSNKFEPDAEASFVVITDQPAFDKVFGVGMVMGDKSHRLPPAAFDKNFVVAAIHRSNGMLTYQVTSVTTEAQTLIVRYTTKTTPDANAKFACPLILSLYKGDYRFVRFVENGKDVKRLPLTPPTAAPAKPGT